MSIPNIPPTATSVPEWIRRCANAVNALISAVAGLEGARESFTYAPVALPGTPVKGQTVYDVADDKVKTWDGTVWQAHW